MNQKTACQETPFFIDCIPLRDRERWTGLSKEYLSILRGMHDANHGVQSMAGLAKHRIFYALDFGFTPARRKANSLKADEVY